MDTAPTSVSREFSLRLLGVDGAGRGLTSRMRFDVSAPYAVEAIFSTGASEPVVWVFARDLLLDSLQGPTGSGDVTGWPTTDALGRRVVHLRLSSPEGIALLEVPADEVEAFLEESYTVVPLGDESRHLDMDSLVDALLRRG